MGSNPTQARGFGLFLIGFTLTAAGFSIGGKLLLVLGGLAIVGVSIAIFLQCKPQESEEE